jgi:hypothetical protein
MDKRIEAEFTFKNKRYIANVLIKDNGEGYSYIVNLFDKQLNKNYPYSYTFIAKDNKFFLEKPMSEDQLELINAIKDALRKHPENTYKFLD